MTAAGPSRNTLAPTCIGCEQQMDVDQAPWRIVVFERTFMPAIAFFCPDCDWRVEMFAANHEGESAVLEDNTPASVIEIIRFFGMVP